MSAMGLDAALARLRSDVYIEHCACERKIVIPFAGEMSSTTNKPAEAPKKGDFEKSLTRLEEVVKRLENTELSLDDAMKLFEEGMKLSHECQKQLEEAEGRVEILLKKADGKIAAQPFEPQDENS
jgi:exodeoxyribonuclease VII small subunit